MEKNQSENHIERVIVHLSPKQQFMDFGLAELKSIIELYGCNLREMIEPEYKRFGKSTPEEDYLINMDSLVHYPFLLMDWPQKLIDKLPEIMKRTVLIKRVIKLYG